MDLKKRSDLTKAGEVVANARQLLTRLSGHRVVRNAALMYAVQMSSYVFPLVILPYLARVLSREKFGLIAFSQMFIWYFIILVDYGFNLTATREVAVNREDSAKVSRIFGAVMGAKAILTVLGFLLMVGVVMAMPKLRPDLDLYLLAFLGVVGNLLFPVWLYQGLEKMNEVALRDFGAKLLALIAIFGLVRGDAEYLLAGAAQPVASLVCGLVVLMRLKSLGVRIELPTWVEVKQAFVQGWVPFLGLSAVSGAMISNVVVLGLWSTPVEVAVFSGGQRIIIALRTMVAPVSTALYPYASQKASRSEREAMEFVMRIRGMVAVPFLVCGVVMVAGAPWLLPWFLGPKYVDSVPVMQIMAFIPLMFSLVQIHSTYYMLACGYDKEWMRITMTVTAFNLIAMTFFLYTMRGAYAIAWTSLLTESLGALIYWRFFRRKWVLL